jgi:drug/metabolite transporter (DMT)-like permease
MFFVWIVLVASAASVWSIDRADQPLGRFTWLPIALILVAMFFVVVGQSALSEPDWQPAESRHWVKIDNETTGALASVWIGLCAGLIGAASALFYTRFYKPTPRPATAAPAMTAPVQYVMAPPMAPSAPPAQQDAPKSNLAQKLEEYARLRAAGTITEDEYANLRQRALNE